MESHHAGETRGLATVKTEGLNQFFSSGEDDKVLFYSIDLRKVIGTGNVST